AGPRIRNGLHDAHVVRAVFEGGMGAHAAILLARVKKTFSPPPLGLQFRRKIDNMQPTITKLTRLHYIRTEIVSERAAAAVNFHPVAWRKRIDSAKLEHAFGLIIESAKHGEQVGNDDF